MIKITIKDRNGNYLDHSNFETEEQGLQWFQPRIDSGFYGKKQYIQFNEITPAVLDEMGNIISPAEVEEVVIPAEHEIEISDIASELAQKTINDEAEEFLKETDWKVIRHRDQQELGIATSLTGEEFQALLQQRQMARNSITR